MSSILSINFCDTGINKSNGNLLNKIIIIIIQFFIFQSPKELKIIWKNLVNVLCYSVSFVQRLFLSFLFLKFVLFLDLTSCLHTGWPHLHGFYSLILEYCYPISTICIYNDLQSEWHSWLNMLGRKNLSSKIQFFKIYYWKN